MYPYLPVEGPAGLLQAEVVVEPLVGEVAALQRQVVAPVVQAVAHREVVRELVGYHVGVAVGAYHLRVVAEAVQVLVVVGHGEQVALSPQVVPVEVDVAVGKHVGHVGHAGLVGEVGGRGARAAYLVGLHVAHVHLREVAAQAQPAAQTVPGREVVALGHHLAVVGIGGILLAAAQVLDVALDIVAGVAVEQAPLDIERVAAQRARVAEVEVHVVAVLGAYVHLSALEVLVAEHLFDGGQPVGLLIRQLGLQPRQHEIGARGAVAALLYGAVDHHKLGALVVGGHGSRHILVVVFPEYRQVPPLRGHEPVRQPGDVLAGLFGKLVLDFGAGEQRGVGAVEGAPHVVEGERVGLVYPVVDGRRGAPVVVVGPGMLFALFAAAAGVGLAVAKPVVAVACRVDIGRDVAVVVGREREVEPPGEEVAFAILQRGHDRVAPAVFLAEDGVLPHPSLYLLVHVRVGDAQHQAVGPGLPGKSRLGHDSLVVVGVVEPLHPEYLVGDDRRAVVVPLLHMVGIDLVVVVRVVLEGVDFVGKSVFEALPEVHVRLVGVERAVGVGRVEKPVAALLVGDDVDYPADGVGTESHRHHSLVHLDALGKVYRDIVQPERTAHSLLRHPVDKHLHVLAAEAVEHELHVRPHAARLAQLDSRGLGQGVAQVFRRVLHLAGIYRNRVVGRPFHPVYSGRYYRDLGELLALGGEGHVYLERLAPFQRDALLIRFIPDGRYHQRVVAGMGFEPVASLLVGGAARLAPLEVDGGVVDRPGRAVFFCLHHTPYGRACFVVPLVVVLGHGGRGKCQ